MDTRTIPKAERIRKARTLALKEATERFNREDMDAEERLLVLERIKQLRKQVEAAARAAL